MPEILNYGTSEELIIYTLLTDLYIPNYSFSF